jgi:hypothetical protein
MPGPAADCEAEVDDARGAALLDARVRQLLLHAPVADAPGAPAQSAPALAELEAATAGEVRQLQLLQAALAQQPQQPPAAGDAWLWLDELERRHEELRAALAGLARAGAELGRCAADQLLPWAGAATALAPTCGLGPRAAAVVVRHRALAEEVAAAAALRRRAAEAASASVPSAVQARLDRARRELGAVTLATALG